MPKFKTLVNGMIGTGEPNIEEYAVPTASDEQPTHGNTFSGMIVDEDIKNQIESGSASDFLYCRRREDGKYDLVPTLPEEGCDPKDPSKTFKIRENHNRLMKGLARKFIDERGNFSYEAGKRFADEFYCRFRGNDPKDIGKFKDINTANPYSLLERASQQNIEWLCNELEIPDKEMDDFRKFFEATGMATSSVIAQTLSFYAQKFEDAPEIGAHLAHLYKGGLLVNKPGKPELTDGDLITIDELTKHYEELDRTKKKLMDTAETDPVTADVVFFTDCFFNTGLTARYRKMSDKLHNRPEPEAKKQSFSGTFPASGPVTDVTAVKWFAHYAPVIGSVTKDGQEYLLTLETIAPAPNTFAKDPPMTKPSIGLYKNLDDFLTSYEKGVRYLDDADKSLAKRMDNTKNAIQPKEEQKTAFGRLMKETDEKGVSVKDTMKELAKSYEDILNSDDRQITKSIQNIKNKYSESILPKDTPPDLHKLVPREIRSKFKDLFSLYDTVRRKTEQLDICKYVNSGIRPKNENSLEYKNFVDKKLTSDLEESQRDLKVVKNVIRYITNTDKTISREDLDRFNNSVKNKYGHNIKDKDLSTFRTSIRNKKEINTCNAFISWAKKRLADQDLPFEKKQNACAVMIAATRLREKNRVTERQGKKPASTDELREQIREMAGRIIKYPAFKRLMQGKTAEDLKNADYMDITRKYRSENREVLLESMNVPAPAGQDKAAKTDYLIRKIAVEKCREKIREDPDRVKADSDLNAMLKREQERMNANERGRIESLLTHDNVMENAANDPKRLMEEYKRLPVEEKLNSFMNPENMSDADKLASKIAAFRINKMLRDDPSMFGSGEAIENMLENTKRRIRSGESFNYMLRNNNLQTLLSESIESAAEKYRLSERIVNTAEDVINMSTRKLNRSDIDKDQKQPVLCSMIAAMEVLNGSMADLNLQNNKDGNKINIDVGNVVQTSIKARAEKLNGSKEIKALKEKYDNQYCDIAQADRKQLFENFSEIKQKAVRAGGMGMK